MDMSWQPRIEPDDHRASAADFVRSFAKWRDKAQAHPVEIASHGRVTHVLLSAQEYERLSAKGSDPASGSNSTLFGLGEWMTDAIIATDGDGEIIYANNVAKSLTGADLAERKSQSLIEALPILRGTVIEQNLGRTLVNHEPTFAEVPSPFREDGWLLCRTIPLRNCVVVILGDITEAVRRDRMADSKQAIVKAMTHHGSVGFMRLSARGVVKKLEGPVPSWLNLSAERISGRALLDFVSREHRLEFREALEKVLDGDDQPRFDLVLTPNGPGVVKVKCAMVHLRGQFGIEGAVIICTREGESLST